MKKALLFLSLFFCLAIIPANAKKDNDSGLLKAYEYLYVDGDLENALDVVNDVLEKSPKDASALRLRAEIYYDLDDYRNALKDINLAIKYNNPKQSKIYNSTLHWLKASIYEVLLDYENQIAELKIALDFAKTDNPDNVRSILFDIGNALYWTGKYNESSGIFQEILDSDETDVAAMTGIARNLIKFKSYEEAAAMMEKAKALDEDYISSYKFSDFCKLLYN